ncbi:unnamed protein product [Cuscuta campestris]|uniref:Uncharacterized protein n=1 Tax=Cuscuta campestris TaxID=132261 RepID=A0A484L8V8_9ASTE|nr:unnamed protein product [Cuscuta campestris]
MDGEPLHPPVVVPYVPSHYEPFIEAPKLEFDTRFNVPDWYHDSSMKALLKILLPLMFKQWGSGSGDEHTGVKVTKKDSDQPPSVYMSMDGDEGGNGSRSEHAGVKVIVNNFDLSPSVHVSMDGIEGALQAKEYKSPSSSVTHDYDDDVNFVPESEEVDGEPMYPKLVVA